MKPLPAICLLALSALPLHAGLFTLSAVNVTALTVDGFDQQTSFVGPTTTSISRTGERTLFDGMMSLGVVGTATSAASARAGAGTLGVQTAVTIHAAGSPTALKASAGKYENPGAGQFFDANGAQADFKSTDLRITPIPGAGVSGAGMLSARLNLDLDGTFTTNPVLAGPGTASMSSTLYLSIRFGYVDPVTHAQGMPTFYAGNVTITQSSGGAPVFGAGTGLLAGYTGGPLAISTAATALPIDVPISLDVRLGAITELTADGTVDYSGGVDFFHTLSLPTTGAVLTLPAGYSTESTELNVAGNSFAAVPEPAGWAGLAATGLLGFALARRWTLRA
jgi:hypothetical protein